MNIATLSRLCLLLTALLHALPASAGDTDTRRAGLVSAGDKPLTLLGHPLAVGERAPGFTLPDAQSEPVSLADYAGKVVIITVFPSIDTRVCATQARAFNQRAAALPDVQILAVSVDLPFALGRFCAAEGIDRVRTLSDHRTLEFGLNYGFVLEERRLLARGTVIVDREGIVRHVEIVPSLGSEPDYDAAVRIASKLTGD